MEKVRKSFGLPTGIAMVIGIVIGSGVFLKAGDVLKLTSGNLAYSLLAWLTGGLIMVVSGFCFAVFANKVEKFNGVIDYVEHSTNRRFGYHLAWLFTTLYYPTVASVVSIFASAYFLHLTGLDTVVLGKEMGVIYELLSKWPTWILAFIFLVLFFTLNYFAPRISAKIQVSSTIIKLIPILVIVIVGLFASLLNKDSGIINAFNKPATDITGITNNFGAAVKKTAFAYEGWVCATSINAELKDSKRNLPKALVIGTIAVVIFYLVYFIGVSAILGNKDAISLGANAPLQIFYKLMGPAGEKIFTIFILISCLGTVNGVAAANSRGLYTMSIRGLGPWADKASKLDKKTGMSKISCIFGFATAVFNLAIWILALQETPIPYFKHLGSMDEIVCAIIYGCYILMFIYMIRNFKDLNIFNRYVMPIIAIIGCSFFILCGTGLYQLIAGQGTGDLINFAIWLSLFAAIEIPSFFFYKKDNIKIKK